MKKHAALALTLVFLLGLSCGGGGAIQRPTSDSRLVVRVSWQGEGIAQKRIAVLELAMEELTDASGIAEFRIPTGTYTLRAYDIDGPGPMRAYIDIQVKTSRGADTRVEIQDCLECVSPASGR